MRSKLEAKGNKTTRSNSLPTLKAKVMSLFPKNPSTEEKEEKPTDIQPKTSSPTSKDLTSNS